MRGFIEAMIFVKSKDGKTQNYSLIMKNEFDMSLQRNEIATAMSNMKRIRLKFDSPQIQMLLKPFLENRLQLFEARMSQHHPILAFISQERKKWKCFD